MLKFFGSWGFYATLFIFILLLELVGLSNLANIIQVTQVFAWGYIIWHLHEHHKLMKELLTDDEDGES